MIEMCQQKNIKMEFRLISKYLLARRIALSFIVCSLIIFGEKGIHAQKNKADKIFLGGDIITVDDKNPEAKAVSVHNGKIQAIGSETEVSKYKGSNTKVIDLKGNTLIPGFIDIHTHPILSAKTAETIDISGFNHKNQVEVMESLKKGIEEKDSGEWVIAYGWDPAILRNLEAPTLKELDQMAPENPLFIISQTIHSGFANSLVLEAAGITKDTPNPVGGYFDKDENGELTGLIVEVGAMAKISDAVPKYPRAAYVYLLTKQMETYSKAGYTTIVAPGLQPIIPKHIQSLQEVAEHPNAPVRVFTYPLFDRLEKTDFKPTHGNHQFKVLGPKFWIDGSPYAGGMAMKEPYLDNEFTRNKLGIKSGKKGHLNYDDERLFFLINKFHKEGWQIAAHVQGERAAKQFLDAVEEAQQSFPRKDYRHRMEHNALVTSEQLKRAFRLGVTPSFYIDHIYYYGDALKEVIVGPKRASRFMPINSAKKAGHRFTIHTDSPSSPIGVLRMMRVAVTRKTRSGKYVLGHDEAITVDDAIKAVTINAAWQIFEEDTRGSLEVGKLADFTVLSRNIKKIPPEEWKSVEIVGTYLAGEPAVNEGWSWRKINLMIQTIWGMIFD
jgi:predicted amidohydrolase YtcJ